MENAYLLSTLPEGRTPTADQIAEMNTSWTATGITKTSTIGTVGMFGYEISDADTCYWGEDNGVCYDEYYFYMKFVPIEDVSASQGRIFRVLFQMGESTAEWHGVEYINPEVNPLTTD